MRVEIQAAADGTGTCWAELLEGHQREDDRNRERRRFFVSRLRWLIVVTRINPHT